MSLLRHLVAVSALALVCASSAFGFDLQSTTVPGRTVPSLTNGEIAINRADKRLIFKNIDGTLGYGSLLNAVPSGRKAVEQGDGSDLSTTSPFAGAVPRTGRQRAADTISVAEYGAVCDGATFDTNAFSSALALAGSALYPRGVELRVPAGRCVVAPGLAQTLKSVTLRGQGSNASTIVWSGSAAVDGLTINGPAAGFLDADNASYGVKVVDLGFDGSAAPNLLRSLVVVNAHTAEFKSLKFRRSNSGIAVSGGFHQAFEDITMLTLKPATGIGIDINGIGDQYLDRLWFDNEVPRGWSYDAYAAIRVTASSGIFIGKGNASHIRSALVIEPGNNQSVEFSDIGPFYADQCSSDGYRIDPKAGGLARGIVFNSTWAGSCLRGFNVTNAAGTTDGVRFVAAKAMANVTEGIKISGGKNHTISAPSIGQNGTRRTGGTVNTNGTAVTIVTDPTGAGVLTSFANNPIVINGTTYTIDQVLDGTHFVLASSAGVQNGVSWSFNTSTDYDGIRVEGATTDVSITAGNVGQIDAQADAQGYGITIADTADWITISGVGSLRSNRVAPLRLTTSQPHLAIGPLDGITDAQGVTPYSTALAIPLYNVVYITGSGIVSSITGKCWIGRKVALLPSAGDVTFQAGNNIPQAYTAPNGKLAEATCFDGTNWYVR